MHILIADDDRIVVNLLASSLKRRGHMVSIAADGMQAFMFARRNQPDLLLLDINMPGGTGFEVLQRMKTSMQTAAVPVVVISGNSDELSRQRALDLGADGFICKVDGLDAALRVVTDFLDERMPVKAAG